jgi:tetratricopeptide (TPR) repeat protein
VRFPPLSSIRGSIASWALIVFLDRRGLWRDQFNIQQTAVAAAVRLGEPLARARAYRNLSLACTRLGRLDDAYTNPCHALAACRPTDDAEQAHIHNGLAQVRDRQGRHREALVHGQRALELYRATGNQPGQANALGANGWCHAQLGEHRAAVARGEEALELY